MSFMTSIWSPVITVMDFVVTFLLPLCLIGHNYARIGITLYKSLQENVILQEGIKMK